MTALNDVLKAEEEARQVVENAKTAATSAIQKAKDEQTSQLEAEEKNLADKTKSTLALEEAKVVKIAESINDEIDNQVRVIDESFEAKKSALKKSISEKFK